MMDLGREVAVQGTFFRSQLAMLGLMYLYCYVHPMKWHADCSADCKMLSQRKV